MSTSARSDTSAARPGDTMGNPWSRRSVILAALVVISAPTWEAPPAGATHAYRCDDLTADPTVNRTLCLPHQAWDAVTAGHPTATLCTLQAALGVDHVKDCHAWP